MIMTRDNGTNHRELYFKPNKKNLKKYYYEIKLLTSSIRENMSSTDSL